MNTDFDILGVYLPALMVLAIVAYGLSLALRRVLAGIGFYRIVWHRALFDTALFIILLGLVTALSQRFLS